MAASTTNIADAAERLGKHQPSRSGEDPNLEAQLQATKDRIAALRDAQQGPVKLSDIEDGERKIAALVDEQVKHQEAKAEAEKKAAAPATKPEPAKQGAPAIAKRPALTVRKGRIRSPRRYGIYGPEGTGKTTLIASIKGVVVNDIEGGSENIDAPRLEYRPGEAFGYIPRSLKEWYWGIRMLVEADHDYTAYAGDTADAIEALCIKHICQREDVDSIEKIQGGFGKGWNVLAEEFRNVLAALDTLRAKRNMDVILTAHASVRPFKNPSGPDYDRYQVKLSEKHCGPLFKEWCHELGFLHFEEGITKENKHAKAKGWSTNRRLMEFDRTGAWDAKARLPLPSRVEVGTANPWEHIERAIEQAFTATPDQIAAMIAEQCARIGDPETTTKVEKAIKDAGANITKLNNYLHELRRRETVKSEDNNEPNFAAPSEEK